MIVVFAGGLGAFALPPFGLVPLFFLSVFVAFFSLDHASSLKQAVSAGWLWGSGYFLFGLWWIGSAFLVEADYLWALPFAVILIPAGLALFTAVGFAVAYSLWYKNALRLLSFAAALTFAEVLRTNLFTGFPWNSFGMVLGSHLPSAQLGAYVGLHGLTFIVLSLFALPALLFDNDKRLRRLIIFAMLLSSFGGLYAFGFYRLAAPPVASVPDVRLRIMQPAIAQDEKFSPENGRTILARYLALSSAGSFPDPKGLDGITHLIWPETAFPFLLDQSLEARREIARILGPDRVLLTGAVRSETSADHRRRLFFNSIHMLDEHAQITASADKVHLVPFGEYLPFAAMIDFFGLRDFITGPGGFTAASDRALMAVPHWPPTVPLICYEAIFPQEVVVKSQSRSGLLLNVTNDAWFGMTPGPYQHFAQARLRAIEQGLPMVRAANNGISAILDPYGRIMTKLDLGEAGIIDGDLPGPLAEQTMFSRLQPYADEIFLIFMGLILTLFTLRKLIPRRAKLYRATSDR